METVYHAWNVVDHARVASGAAELAIFTALLYWFFTSSRVADMLEVVGERVGGWCGRDGSLRQAVRARRRDVYAKIDADAAVRNASLYRLKDGPVVPPPQPHTRPTIGLACPRCAPHSRESWQEADGQSDTVVNILDIGRQRFAGGGVVSRHLCDLAQCMQLQPHDYRDVTPEVVADARFQSAIEEEARRAAGDDGAGLAAARGRVEARALAVLASISSAMSTNVLKLVAWLTHKAVRRVAGAGCGTRAAVRLAAARAAGLPLVFVPLHRSHLDYILVTFTLYLTGVRPPLVAAGDNMRIPLFGWFLRGCGAFFIRRGQEGSDHNTDNIYKSALRAYILNSLAANNNLEFFIEGGRTRTGKPQLPKAGILSVILDAYLEGTISDALLVPVTVNYDKLVDGSFVREQLGVPKRMETFWSALRGIWRTLNTNHGGIRVDFNQPVSLKELVSSFDKYGHLVSPPPAADAPGPAAPGDLDRRLLSLSRSAMLGADVSERQRVMVEAIGRHLVYDAAQSTALMCTNVTAYVLATEMRGGGSPARLQRLVAARGAQLRRAGRDLGYCGDVRAAVTRALDTLGRGLVRRGRVVRAAGGVGAAIELAYYANAVVAHYAPAAIVATALESLVVRTGASEVNYDELMAAALRLAEILSNEFILCPPCQRVEDRLADAVDELVAADVLAEVKAVDALEEQRWSRRVAAGLDDAPPPAARYRLSAAPAAAQERRRLILTLRPLLEAYAAACGHVQAACGRDAAAPQKALVTATLDRMLEDFAQNRMTYGEAISTDAIRNCHRLLRQWGVIDIRTEDKQRVVRLQAPYDDPVRLADVCDHVYRYNVNTPLLDE